MSDCSINITLQRRSTSEHRCNTIDKPNVLCFNHTGMYSLVMKTTITRDLFNRQYWRTLPWLPWPLWNIYVTNDHGYVPLVVNPSWCFPHSWLITGFVNRLTRRVPLVEQEPLTLLLVIVWSAFLRFTDSDYPLGIFKLFLDNIAKLKHRPKSNRIWYKYLYK